MVEIIKMLDVNFNRLFDNFSPTSLKPCIKTMYKTNDKNRTKMYNDIKPPSSLFRLLKTSKITTGTASIRESIPATPAYLIVLFIDYKFKFLISRKADRLFLWIL